jgi:hypothetical protein
METYKQVLYAKNDDRMGSSAVEERFIQCESYLKARSKGRKWAYYKNRKEDRVSEFGGKGTNPFMYFCVTHYKHNGEWTAPHY